ncbi:uncharacterized protein LOC119445958 isoform X1 [Dermacentor silvarum]|uniref:uncharacterized protein LOC119445958 isoform X1 n=1 Tax=Dermacentor silvarum TaxID=543639 RepID=UPI001898A792|nr:uncharacterized protein LOC119445958 isoform X1 [Dermacentor silvarum]
MSSLFAGLLLVVVSLCSALNEARGDESGGALSPSGASKGTGRLDKLSGVEYPRGPGGHRHLDRLSGGELLRSLVLPYVLRGLSSSPDYVSRRSMDKAGSGEHIRTAGAFLPGSLPAKRQAPFDSLSGLTFGGDQAGVQKRGYGHGEFDEIDNAGWPGFYKRNFDEIDRSDFGGFYKRNFDEIDRTGFEGFYKRSAARE